MDSESDQSDHDESDLEGAPPTKTSRKWSGAAIYKSKYQTSWQKKWPFLSPVKYNPHSCLCSVCKMIISCAHQGERDVLRHIDSVSHKRNAQALHNIQPLNFGDDPFMQLLKEKVNCSGVMSVIFCIHVDN